MRRWKQGLRGLNSGLTHGSRALIASSDDSVLQLTDRLARCTTDTNRIGSTSSLNSYKSRVLNVDWQAAFATRKKKDHSWSGPCKVAWGWSSFASRVRLRVAKQGGTTLLNDINQFDFEDQNLIGTDRWRESIGAIG